MGGGGGDEAFSLFRFGTTRLLGKGNTELLVPRDAPHLQCWRLGGVPARRAWRARTGSLLVHEGQATKGGLQHGPEGEAGLVSRIIRGAEQHGDVDKEPGAQRREAEAGVARQLGREEEEAKRKLQAGRSTGGGAWRMPGVRYGECLRVRGCLHA